MSTQPAASYCNGCQSEHILGPETTLYHFPPTVPSTYVRVCPCGTSTVVDVGDGEQFREQLENSMVHIFIVSDPFP